MAGETVTATRAADTFPAFQPFGSNVAIAWGERDLATTEMEAADVVQMCRVPKGARVIAGWLYVDDLDTATTITIDVGDGDDPDRYVAASTTGRTGGVITFGRTATLQSYTYPAEDTIDIRTPAAGNQAGKVLMYVLYTIENG